MSGENDANYGIYVDVHLNNGKDAMSRRASACECTSERVNVCVYGNTSWCVICVFSSLALAIADLSLYACSVC